MARIPRKQQKVFAGNAINNGQFGSAQDGTKVTSQDLDVIQQLDAFIAGWNDATISSQRLPTLEEMQALHYMTTSQIAYLFQEGIPEFLITTEYHQNSIVRKSGTYELYGSLVNDNVGNALPVQVDNANWTYLGSLEDLSSSDAFSSKLLHIQDQKPNNTNGGSAVAGANTRDLNTILVNDIAGASLSSNTITLPAGDYYCAANAPTQIFGDVDMGHQAVLYNSTDAANLLVGTSEYLNTEAGVQTQTRSFINGQFTLADTKLITLRSICSDAFASSGLGRPAGVGLNEVYSEIKLWRLN